MPEPEVICIPNGMFAENCYVLADRERAEAVLVDPGEEANVFLDRLRQEELVLKGVWLTHAHLDHIMGVPEIVRETGADIWLHPADRPLYDGVVEQGAWLNLPAQPCPPPDHELVPGTPVQIGSIQLDVRFVPGHSPGSVAFVADSYIICGDVLFSGSIGRTDLPGGDLATLLASIEKEVMTLDDSTVVHSGHGPATTVGEERATNPFLNGYVPGVR